MHPKLRVAGGRGGTLRQLAPGQAPGQAMSCSMSEQLARTGLCHHAAPASNRKHPLAHLLQALPPTTHVVMPTRHLAAVPTGPVVPHKDAACTPTCWCPQGRQHVDTPAGPNMHDCRGVCGCRTHTWVVTTSGNMAHMLHLASVNTTTNKSYSQLPPRPITQTG
jgi:hypothetical protein